MSLTFNVDGVVTENPGDTDIAHAFESLGKGTGFFTGPGLSLITLQRDEAISLMATGTYAMGFMLTYQDGDPHYEYNSNPDDAISVDEAVRTFQSYAAGKDWGQSSFKWERNEVYVDSPKVTKRLIIYVSLGCLVYLAVKFFTAK